MRKQKKKETDGKIDENFQQMKRERLLLLIEETSPKKLYEERSLLWDCYTIRDGNGVYCIYQHGGGRWYFSEKGKKVYETRQHDPREINIKDNELVDIFTHKVFQYIKEQNKKGIHDESGLNGI